MSVLLTTTQAGKILGVSRWTIREWVRQGALPQANLPGHIRIPRAAVYAAAGIDPPDGAPPVRVLAQGDT